MYFCNANINGMESVRIIASYICDRYKREFGEQIDEMKLHKLLYLTQRECLMLTGEPMFEATFHAWRYGPVLPEIRKLYKADALHNNISRETELEYKTVFDRIFREFAGKRSSVLSNMTHGDYSWRHAREGYGKYEDSDVPMLLDDIRKDAEYFKRRISMLHAFDRIGLIKEKLQVFLL